MALLLIKESNAFHADPAKDQRGCYKRGDIVQILDDSAHNGNLVENPIMPPFVMVRITGVTKEQIEHYARPEYETPGDTTTPVVRRREFRVRVDDIPASIRNQLRDNRYVEVTRNQVINYIQNKRTGENES